MFCLFKWDFGFKVIDKCVGCILVTMIGDILGASVEGWRASLIKGTHGTLWDFVEGKHMGVKEPRYGMYSDDTNSTLALCSSLVEKSVLDPAHVALENCRFYQHLPPRGYSDQSESIMLSLISGEIDYTESGTYFLPKGSWANGGAMKIAPIGIAFSNVSNDILYEAARLAILSTHCHKEGIDGAWLQAKAVAVLLKSSSQNFEGRKFLEDMRNLAKTDKMKMQFNRVLHHYDNNSNAETVSCSVMNSVGEIGSFFQLRASQSVPLAFWALAKFYKDPEEGLVQIVSMGGDTDTIAAIGGALFGALLGTEWIPTRWWSNIENGEYGRDYAVNLSKKLSKLNLTGEHILQYFFEKRVICNL